MKVKIIPLIVALLSSTAVSAAVITRTEDGNLSVSGNLGKELKGTEVQVQILGPFEEKPEPETAVYVATSSSSVKMTNTYINTAITDLNGEYNLNYTINETNKFYLTMVKEPGSDNVQTGCIYAMDEQTETQFLSAVNSADFDAMSEIITGEEYRTILIGNRADFEKITDSESLENLARELVKGRSYASFAEFEKKLTEVCAVLISNNLTDATSRREIAEEKLELNRSSLYEIYLSLDEKSKNDVFKRMSGEKFNNFEDYLYEFESGVFLEKIKSEKYASNLTELINTNANHFGLYTEGYSKYYSKVNNNLYGKDFKDIDAFNEKLKAELRAAKNSASSSSGGGGGNGGGGGGGSSAPKQNIVVASSNSVNTPSGENKGFFNDLDGVEWATEAINELAQMGVISGKAEGKFAPMDDIKREEFVKMVVKAFNLTADEGEISFLDVEKGAWYYNDIKTAYLLGIVNGTDEDKFGTGSLINRQDMSAILYRTAQKLGKELKTGNELFADDNQISDYAKEAVYSLKNEGIISGMGDNCFAPKNNATRAQAAKMIYLIMNK